MNRSIVVLALAALAVLASPIGEVLPTASADPDDPDCLGPDLPDLLPDLGPDICLDPDAAK